MKISKRQIRASHRESAAYPDALVPVAIPPPLAAANPFQSGALPMNAWRSRRFLVVLWIETNGARRLSIMRTEFDKNGVQLDGITWDELQRLKGEAGFHDECAVEIYPPDSEIVNVANMRHLWLLSAPPAFMWSRNNGGNASP